MLDALPLLLWVWVGAPIATIGAVAVLLMAGAQWGRVHEWRQGARTTTAHAEIKEQERQ